MRCILLGLSGGKSIGSVVLYWWSACLNRKNQVEIVYFGEFFFVFIFLAKDEVILVMMRCNVVFVLIAVRAFFLECKI